MPFPYTVYLDKELNLLHIPGCSGTKMASKYGYGETIYVRNLEQARQLDVEHRACDRCQKEIKKKAKGGEKMFRYRKNPRQGQVWE